jgi:hypothetical protein
MACSVVTHPVVVDGIWRTLRRCRLRFTRRVKDEEERELGNLDCFSSWGRGDYLILGIHSSAWWLGTERLAVCIDLSNRRLVSIGMYTLFQKNFPFHFPAFNRRGRL